MLDKDRALEHYFEPQEIRSISVFPDIEMNIDNSEEGTDMKKEQSTKEREKKNVKKDSKSDPDTTSQGISPKEGDKDRISRKKKRKCSS